MSRTIASGSELVVKPATLRPLTRKPPVIRHDIQFGGQAYWSGYDWSARDWGDDVDPLLDLDDKIRTNIAPPSSANREDVERLLRRSFETADTSGDGKLSRKEFFSALDQSALLEYASNF